MAIEKTLRFIVLGGIFALPFIVFIVAQSLFFPFITGKNFTFRIIVEVITGAYLALALVNPVFRPKRSWLLGLFALFVLVVALADALGVYPFKSFWSNYERMDGWVTLVHLFFYFLVASSVLNTEKLWRAFWHVSISVSAIVGVYGLLQLAGVASLNPGFSSLSRIDATLGNPIYLAAYMLFNIGIAAMLWARAWQETILGERFWLSVLYGGVIALNTVILFMTGTRGAMLGLIGGALLAALLTAFSSQTLRRTALAGVVAILVLAGGFWLVRGEAWVQKVPFLQRLATISLEDNTTKARFMNWGMAWQGVKERPILGWGQENYAIVFDKYYDPRMYAQEQWFDRVHNIVFDWLVAAGFAGLFSYLSIMGAAVWLLWRPSVERRPSGERGSTEASRLNVGSTEASTPNVRRSESNTFSVAESSILTGLLAAYFFHNLFVFDNITSYVLFVSVLAYIAWRGSTGAEALPMPRVPQRAVMAVAISAAVLVWGVAWFVNAKALSANRALLNGLAQQEGGLQKNLEYFKESISYGSFGTQEAREQLAQAAAQIVRSEAVPVEVKQDFLNTAAEEMSRMSAESPLDARFPLFLGALLGASGNLDTSIPVLQKAHELSPGKQTILFELASSMSANGDVRGALSTYKQAYELEPNFNDARIWYASAAIRAQEDALADELLAPLLEKGGAADPRIAAAYVSRGRYDKIAQIWEAHLKLVPNDAQAYFTLAAAYYGMGNSTLAISTLEKIAAIAPGAKAQADALIEQVRNGTAKVQ